MSQILELHDEIEIVEEATLRTWLGRLLIWGAILLIVGAAAAVAAFTLL